MCVFVLVLTSNWEGKGLKNRARATNVLTILRKANEEIATLAPFTCVVGAYVLCAGERQKEYVFT